MAVAIMGLLAISGCSTDVQRFGQTGAAAPSNQLRAPNSVASAPLAPLQSNANRAGGISGQRYADARSGSGSRPGSDGMIRVGTGDTLYSISRANGIRVEDLAAANGIRFPYHVRFGQRIRLPGSAPRTIANRAQDLQVAARPVAYAPAPTSSSAHVVQPKETLYSVSRQYRINVKDLAAANGLTLASGLQIGQRLSIPNGPVSAQRRAAVGGPLVPALAKRAAQPAPVRVAVAQPTLLPVPALAGTRGVNQNAVVKPVANSSALAEPPSRASRQFRWPVRGRLISRFGPQTDGGRSDGVNISVPEGTSVKAAENGVVAYAGNELKGYGNLILVRHSGDWVTAYAHNSEILVERGTTVKRGQIIAKAGKTGSVKKPQVHFQVRKGAKAVDPLIYLEGA
ncbi:MAG: peptidoglycan DD-metalloendopeptidase family protein [Alphaproteobacteria bacterium]|nr:peptidoglycan DD-metalloendopeptidase family protein [Alphaproteobacteria bacterium]